MGLQLLNDHQVKSAKIYDGDQRVELRLVEANPVSGALRFELPDAEPSDRSARPSRERRDRQRPGRGDADEEAADRALPSTTTSDLDAEFDEMRAQAQAKHCVLRYVGLIDVEKKIIKAGLEAYPADHPFATSLGGSDNILSFTTERYPRPLLVQGAGAGADVTAMGVVADLVRVAERRG